MRYCGVRTKQRLGCLSWQFVFHFQQCLFYVVENDLVRNCHFGTHRITAEDHSPVGNRQVADRPVKFSTLDRQILTTLLARQFQPRSNLLLETRCRNHNAIVPLGVRGRNRV
jgi:hypothetical protein